MLFILKFFYTVLFKDYFYRRYRKMVWHPIYSQNLPTEQRRLLREQMLPHEWNDAIWWKAQMFWGCRCAACRAKRPYLQRDHIVPLAHINCPGAVPSNLIPLCLECNKDKSYHDLAAWYERKFHRSAEELVNKVHDWQYLCLLAGYH